ncbi:GFA family protein [Aspergillus clavatus NRRL 1]|uniref:DUF636 domain protein n=1 Tax=Aspergillus clavatus (strain ATCC 1007 / CBS 513.65 / DSM 816 / NCTC 3887 / NRRL 1 / QM 1276 / 107) TaxID=344612 RepID=A1CBW7_ASPCL|nr:DUF636 domain protein [Aspergillus clavatus NRRL 1]EAW13235.1 DUF636 domain protein [Aspergillus clavatus NRRL 1]
MTSTRSGSCLCGAVQYKLAGDPEKLFICHCESCQKATGSAFMANCWYQESQLEITQGQDSIQVYNDKATATGEPLQRSFCGTCGSRLFHRNNSMVEAQYVSVSSGTIDDRDGLEPTIELWQRNRRPWLAPLDGIEKLDQQ